jgi:hypothetical protein
MDSRKGNNDLALMAQFHHDALSAGENAVTDSDSRPDADALMWPQEQSACQPVTNLVQFFATDHVPFFIAQKAKDAGRGDYSDPLLG